MSVVGYQYGEPMVSLVWVRTRRRTLEGTYWPTRQCSRTVRRIYIERMRMRTRKYVYFFDLYRIVTRTLNWVFGSDVTCTFAFSLRKLKPCSHLTPAFPFFFDLCRQMQTLSMNTIICCHINHSISLTLNDLFTLPDTDTDTDPETDKL